jgi:acetyl-CoA acetyltransferase
MAKITDKYAIVGVGESDRSKHASQTRVGMAVTAGRLAMADAGLKGADIDCVMSYQIADSCNSHTVATHLGIRPTFYMDAIGGGGATEMLIANAIGLIEAGVCKTALLFRSMHGRSGKRMGGGPAPSNGSVTSSQGMSTHLEAILPEAAFTVPYGLASAAATFALVAMRHMWETGTTEEHLGHVILTFYEHAQRNPKAFMNGSMITMEEYLRTPLLVSPFRKHDFCLESDEANAIIVTSADRARDLRPRPIYIMGIAAHNCTHQAMVESMPDITDVGSFYAARQVWPMSGLKPSDIDVAAIYDCFSWVVLAQLEAFGFVGRGEAGPFVAEGNLKLGGKLPANTAGGMQGEGYTHGMNNLIELVRQLRHTYAGTERQVMDCETGFGTGWDGPHSGSAIALRR